MSLSHRHRDRNHQQIVDDLTPLAATRARISTQRADRLREFILGHLPDEVTVDVVITSGVQTAAVLPADTDAILSSNATEFERVQAERLLDGVDADYLVLVTGNETDLTRIPLNDQLTADHAHQFGLAFHELLHILKTAITAIGELLESKIDAQYHSQVHDLINIIEDGAIEAEAIHGENFSDNAGIRLELTRRLHSQTLDDIPDGQTVRYSFWDAVTSCLYDETIYPTGMTDVLLDEDDGRVQFKSEGDRDAFITIHPELCNLSADVFGIQNADRLDTTHAHDKTASIRRARRVIRTWCDHIQPIIEADQDCDDAEDNGVADRDAGAGDQRQQDGRGDLNKTDADAPGQSETVSDPDSLGDSSSGSDGLRESSTDTSTEATAELPDDFDPSSLSLSREATENPSQNIFEQPQVTPDPGPDDVDDEVDADSEGDQEGEDDSGGECEAGRSDTSAQEDAGADRKGGEIEDSSETTDAPAEPQNRAEAIAQATDRARQHEQQPTSASQTKSPSPTPSPETSDSDDEPTPDPQSASSSSINRSSNDQLSLDAFSEAQSEPDGESTGNEGNSPDEDGDTIDKPNEDAEAGTETVTGNEGDETDELDQEQASFSEQGTNSERELDSDTPDGPAHAQSSERSPEEKEAAYKNALSGDERAAHDEADREAINERALEDELDALSDYFDRQQRQQPQNENSGQSGGSGYTPDSLTDLEILPVSDDLVSPREWAAIEDGADRVADTLEMYLRLNRRKSIRRGLSAGSYDTRAGHRLAIGDPRVCKSRTMGNEKQYALVLILDRSGSMRGGSPAKIEVATRALARFALAAETLGIRVAIIDFIHGQARLVKPFSIETRYVQATLLDTSCGGGTPLADAIDLANDLVEAQRDDPLIIGVGDDQTSADAVKDVIRRAYAPVCSLTIATDHEPGTLSGSASKLAPYYERQETVYTPERLDDRLDQFASLLARH